MAPPPFFNEIISFTQASLWIELVFSLIIIIACSIIYFRTKELYELTSYKSIKYFRNAFLFFGIAFLVRLLLRLASLIIGIEDVSIVLFWIGIAFSAFAGLIAGFYLMYGVLWKKLEKSKFSKYTHPIPLGIIALIFVLIFHGAALIAILALYIIAIYLAYKNRKESKKKTGIAGIHVIYILLFISWIAGWAAQFAIRFSLIGGIIQYSLSSILFLIILYRVIKITK